MKKVLVSPAAKSKSIANALIAPRFDAASFLSSVGDGRTSVKYRSKDTIFSQGDAVDAVYYIQKGRIRLTVLSEHGKEAIIAQPGAGEFFGEGGLAGQSLHLATAIATSDCVIARIELDTMIRVLHDQPKLAEVFMSFLLLRNIQIEADLVDQLFNSSERRLARVLLLLSNFGKDGKLEVVIPKISQATLAAKVGTTRARINFFMNKFRKLGFIEYDAGAPARKGGLKVHSSLINIIVHD